MTSERTVVQISDSDFEQYQKNVKEMEYLILAAEKSYEQIERIRHYSFTRCGNTKSIDWVKNGKSIKFFTK